MHRRLRPCRGGPRAGRLAGRLRAGRRNARPGANSALGASQVLVVVVVGAGRPVRPGGGRSHVSAPPEGGACAVLHAQVAQRVASPRRLHLQAWACREPGWCWSRPGAGPACPLACGCWCVNGTHPGLKAGQATHGGMPDGTLHEYGRACSSVPFTTGVTPALVTP